MLGCFGPQVPFILGSKNDLSMQVIRTLIVVGGVCLSACVGADVGLSVVTDADIPPDIHRDDSWARLPLPVRDELDADGQRVFDFITDSYEGRSGGPRGALAMWIYSPLMAEHIIPFRNYLRFGTDMDQRLTELAILVTTREVRSQFLWTAHEPLALQAGLEPELIDLVKRRAALETSPQGLGQQERVIVQFTREALSEERVSSEMFARALELFGEKGVMDLAGLIAYYNIVNITFKTFDIQLAPGSERLLPELW